MEDILKRLNIDRKQIEKQGYTLAEVLAALYASCTTADFRRSLDSFISKQMKSDLFSKVSGTFLHTNKQIIKSVLAISEDMTEETITQIARAISNEFPEGNKPGTSYKWRCSESVMVPRIKKLILKYKLKCTPEEAAEAARRYVASYANDQRYMRLAKYFVYKYDEEIDDEGKKVGSFSSEFMEYLENKSDNTAQEDWDVTMRY